MPVEPVRARRYHRGFSRAEPNMGYKMRGSGSYTFKLPKITEKIKKMSLADKRMWLFNFNASQRNKKGVSVGRSNREVARAFGVHDTTIMKWRAWIIKLAEDSPEIAAHLLNNREACEKYATDYYACGGNELGKKYKLTGFAVRGLITSLAVFGFVKQSREALIATVKTNGWKFDDTVYRTVTTVW